MSTTTYGSLHSSRLSGYADFRSMNPQQARSRTLTPQSSILTTDRVTGQGSRKVHFPPNPECTTYYTESGYALNGKATTALEMPQFDPADTGSIGSTGTPDSGLGEPDFHVLNRDELHHHCKKFTLEIRNLAYLTQDFRSDVITGTSNPVSLLDEYSFKIKPYLVKLDERLATLEELVRRNLDQCKISEPRVDWLIQYHQIVTSLREMVSSLNVQLFERMEAILRLQARGCEGSKLGKSEVEGGLKILKKITQELDLIQDVKMKA